MSDKEAGEDVNAEEMMERVAKGESIVRAVTQGKNGVYVGIKADRSRGGFVRIERTIENYDEVLAEGREKRLNDKKQGE